MCHINVVQAVMPYIYLYSLNGSSIGAGMKSGFIYVSRHGRNDIEQRAGKFTFAIV